MPNESSCACCGIAKRIYLIKGHNKECVWYENMKTSDIIENCWLRTFTGKVIDPTNIKVSDIDLIDIGHALSNICRFGGHSNTFHSVAEHCLLVYELIKKDHPFNKEFQ